MCSIPGLPTPGSEIPVHITRVNRNGDSDLVELWVNMDDGRKHIYEQMREEIQIPKKKFCGSEGKPGDLCLVSISDTWHRARIVSTQSETCDVFLIDRGRPHTTLYVDLAWGQSDSFLLPPETESCVLANVLTLENESVKKYLASLPGKKMKGLVQHVLMPDRTIILDIPIVSKHLCEIGVAGKIPVDEFKSIVQKWLEDERIIQEETLDVSCQLEKHDQYFYPELSTNSFETVNVTEVTDPYNIFCKLQIFSKAVKILSGQIQQHYEESSDLGDPQALTYRDPCAARGTDGRWHRSLLNQTRARDGPVEVFHVDEGKRDFVPMGDIRPLHRKFLRMPVVTYPCSLEGINDNSTEWTTHQTDYLKSLLLNQTVVAKFNHHNLIHDVYHVTLYADNGTCINKCLREKEGPFPPSETEQDSNVQDEPFPSYLSSPGRKCCMDLQNKVNVDGSQEETMQRTKNLEVNGRTGDVPTSGAEDTHIKESSEHPKPLVQINGHHSTSFPSEVQNACDDNAFIVGSSVNVKVSCIESLQKFWCQTTENGDSLRHLMQDLQNHYASVHPQPLVESICVARNPDNGMWYRARIMASHHSPVVEVRFIDYGQTQTVPLRDVRPIDPAFLRLNAQAFQCCLDNQKNSTGAAEFQKFVDLHASSNIELKCTVKAVTSDEEGLPVNVVDIETTSNSACKLLTQEGPQAAEDLAEIPLQVPLDAYNYSTHDIEVNGKEKVWITYAESVNQFYCQLDRNVHLFDKVMEDVKQLTGQPQCTGHPLGHHSICFAKYTDNQWYRGQVVEMSPKLKVHFVDFGHTVEVKESDICTFPVEATTARSVPVQAVPLGLSEVPAEVPQEVNEWFADSATGQSFTMSVVAKGEKGKLIVELFDGPLNVNMKVREAVSKMTQQRMPAPEIEHETTLDEGRRPTSDKEVEGGHNDSEMKLPSYPEGNVNICTYKWPKFSPNKREEVYASCIVGPYYFWCQYTNTEDLNMVTRLAQEAGQAQQDMVFPETLGPGSPCLALFSSDNQWYRAQVIDRAGDAFSVVFIDYGNESDVDIKNVRPLPPSLLEKAPLAFLCSFNGFDESEGSWDDEVHDDFYNLLVDKPLRVTVFNMEDHSEIMVPQYAVEIECEGVAVNAAMQKYWKPVAQECVSIEHLQTEPVLQDRQIESIVTHLRISKGNTCKYKKPNLCENRKEEVYASCIEQPHFFWCQYANTEELGKVLKLTLEAGQTEQDMMFPETLGPGSPCLALFPSDNQWYRAQVIHRAGDAFHVLFIDYGNQSEVDIKNVRSLPPSLLEKAPQAFLCSLNGFDKSRGSWDDKAHNAFYNLLVDKALRVTVFNMEDHLEIGVPRYAVEIECEGAVVNTLMEKYWTPVAKERVLKEHPKPETFLQDSQIESNVTHLSISKGNTCKYKKPSISKNRKEAVYASSIVDPHFFWCQHANTEELNKVSSLAQEAGQAQQDMMFPETLGPGSPCLALFSSDNQWYRAQVINRAGEAFNVLFIDYGNESDVDIKNVRSLPPSLLEKNPQAFLCSLNGFDKSGGSWIDEVYDDFYSLLVDKPLTLTAFKMDYNSEAAVPQYAVDIECEGAVVNTLMEKYWKGVDSRPAIPDDDEC